MEEEAEDYQNKKSLLWKIWNYFLKQLSLVPRPPPQLLSLTIHNYFYMIRNKLLGT